MKHTHAIDLYELLPALYRQRDAERGYPLRALLGVVTNQVDLVKENIDGLWDDFFIETCEEWVLPYIGKLIGNNPLHGLNQGIRADVAKTIYYRRRKGTLPMLEELARDITGWRAHAVAGFEQLGWTQNLNHQRYESTTKPWDDVFDKICAAEQPNPLEIEGRALPAVDRVGTVNLRNTDLLDRLDDPFDIISHAADLRRPGPHAARHNLDRILFFLWRLGSYPLHGVEPRRRSETEPHRFHFSPLGNPAPLFHHPQREAGEYEMAGEIHVPGRMRHLACHFRRSDYYGHGKSLAIYRGPKVDEKTLIPAQDLLFRKLDSWTEPPANKVAVDVEQGRFVFPADEAPKEITVSFHYGFGGSIGGGPYPRRTTLEEADTDTLTVSVSRQFDQADYSTLADALRYATVGKDLIVNVIDSATYQESLIVEVATDQRVVIQAAEGQRPHLQVMGGFVVKGVGNGSALTLNGLVIEGNLEVQGHHLDGLTLLHCTLVPGLALKEDGEPKQPDRPSLSAAVDSAPDRVTIRHSIVGALRLPRNTELTIQDSIVQGLKRNPAISSPGTALFGPSTTLQRVTVFGDVHVAELPLASEVIFMGLVSAERPQVSSLRFTYLGDPASSRIPRRYRCQPDLVLTEAAKGEETSIRERLRPAFTSTHYGHPGYAQLTATTVDEIRKGAEDGSEMGAFNYLRQPQRETNLRIRLEEYMPFGLKAGVAYAT